MCLIVYIKYEQFLSRSFYGYIHFTFLCLFSSYKLKYQASWCIIIYQYFKTQNESKWCPLTENKTFASPLHEMSKNDEVTSFMKRGPKSCMRFKDQVLYQSTYFVYCQTASHLYVLTYKSPIIYFIEPWTYFKLKNEKKDTTVWGKGFESAQSVFPFLFFVFT